MNNLKKFGKPSLFIGTTLICYVLLLSLFHNLGILKLASLGKINFVAMSLFMFLLGFSRGKKASKKGYLEGLKIGGIAVAVLFLLNILFTRHFDLYVVLYYLVLLTSAVIGSMIGINLRR